MGLNNKEEIKQDITEVMVERDIERRIRKSGAATTIWIGTLSDLLSKDSKEDKHGKGRKGN